MAIFGPKPWLTPLEKCQFLSFLNCQFLQPGKTSFRSRISSDTFSRPILPKKISEKWPFLDLNHGLTFLEKCQFLGFLNCQFLQPRKTCFRSRILSDTFSRPILPKKKRWKNGHIWTKTMVNPFGKMSIFELFKLLVFIAWKDVFPFQNIVRHIFQAYIA